MIRGLGESRTKNANVKTNPTDHDTATAIALAEDAFVRLVRDPVLYAGCIAIIWMNLESIGRGLDAIHTNEERLEGLVRKGARIHAEKSLQRLRNAKHKPHIHVEPLRAALKRAHLKPEDINTSDDEIKLLAAPSTLNSILPLED